MSNICTDDILVDEVCVNGISQSGGTDNHDLLNNRNIADQHPQSAITDLEADLDAKEPSFSKNQAFNKDFGSSLNSVAEGNDPRLSDDRTPVAHDHNSIYHQKDEFITGSAGAVDSGKPILLNQSGKVDPSMLDFTGLTPQGSWAPTALDEYPTITVEPDGAYWVISEVDEIDGYLYLTGDLIGETAYNGDILLLASSGWSLLSNSIDPNVYYRIDGTTAIVADFLAGGFKIVQMADGTASDDGATIGQLTSGLALKSDLDHSHTGEYELYNPNIQQHVAQITSNPHQVTKAEVGLSNADNTSDSLKPVSNPTQSALNGKEEANPNLQAHLINTSNPHSVNSADIGLDNVDNTTDANKPVSSATQTALDGKAPTAHDHDGSYYKKTDHVTVGGTPTEADKPILLDANGLIDASLIGFEGFTPQGPWTPVDGAEYPVITDEPNGSYWTIDGVDPAGYLFLTGDLTGKTIENGQSMMIGSNGWVLLGSNGIDPTVYLRLDGSSPMQADFPHGGFKSVSMGDGILDADGATVGQLNAGLATKADTGHNHDADYDVIGSADIIQGNLDAHEADAAIHYPQSTISITESQVSDLGDYLTSEIEGGAGTPLANLIRMTQAEYDSITPIATTVYFIVG